MEHYGLKIFSPLGLIMERKQNKQLDWIDFEWLKINPNVYPGKNKKIFQYVKISGKICRNGKLVGCWLICSILMVPSLFKNREKEEKEMMMCCLLINPYLDNEQVNFDKGVKRTREGEN